MSDLSVSTSVRRRHYIKQRLARNGVRIVPMCMILGGCMELFMLNTGFYDVVKRKEAERIVEKRHTT